MKILHVYKTYYPDSTGGVEKSIENMAQGLKKLKVSSKILTLSNNVSVNKKVISLKKTFEIFSTPFSFKLLFKFKSISNKSKKSSNNKAKKQKNKLEQEILLLNEVFKKEPPRCKNKGLDYPCCCTFDPKTRHHKCYKSLNQCDPNPLKGTLGYKLGKK